MEENKKLEKEEKNEIKEKPKKLKKNKKCKLITIVICILLAFAGFIIIFFTTKPKEEELPKLPKPEITDGVRGEFGIDKNINESTIDNYLGRSDSVYRDMRMLEDPAKYENIGGDRFLSGYIKGFEVIPLPYIIPVEGLPEEVGDTYGGNTLFHEENGKYIANYKESKKILEEIFPRDKVIFLICGGGGYAGMTKNFLISMGYDENKIYNVGGYWYYKGKNNIEVPRNADGSLNFNGVPYHKINFNKLTKASKYKEPKVKVTEIKISTNKIELEEGTSFKLNAIVLPNEATNKEVKWKSKNESIATVDKEGLVKAISSGTTTITIESVDGKKTVSCEVTVKKKKVNENIKIDNISSEIAEFNSYDIEKVNTEFNNTVYNADGTYKEEYSTPNEYGGRDSNDLFNVEYNKYMAKYNDLKQKKANVINKLIDSKKSFIILSYNQTCEEREYSVVDGTEKVLKQNGYSYLYAGSEYINGTEILFESKLSRSQDTSGSIFIVKSGEIYGSINPDVDSIKSESELKNWLSKYIDIK